MGRTRERAWRNLYEPKKKVLEAKTIRKQAQKLFYDDDVDVIDLSDSAQEQCDSVETASSMLDSSFDDDNDKREECELVENVSPVPDSRRRGMRNQIEIGIREVVHDDTQGLKKTTDYASSLKGKRKEHIPKGCYEDFQTHEKRKKHDEHANEKPNTLQIQPFVTFTNKRLETVIPPSNICYALTGLSYAQKAAIKSMGFESIKYMNILTVPAALGYWLLTNYDHTHNTLHAGTHRIKITPTIVHDILGVPMGANNVKEGVNTMNYKSVYLAEWERQFGTNLTRISVRQVIERMKLQKNGGRLFKLNFLVLFNTIMGETTKDTTANARFLTSIKKLTDIANMDWCSYIITCLKRTKEEWNGVGPYNGPLTFLAVLYAHDQRLRHTPAKAKIPAIQYVKTESLLKLESNLYKPGGISKTHVDVTEKDHTEGGDESKSFVEAGVKKKTSAGIEQTQQNEQMGKESSHESDVDCVQGYKVKPDIAPILKTILDKHGDIAAECLFKTDSVRSSFLEAVCEAVKLIQTGDVIDRMEEIECQVSDAKAANINVSWLQAHLEAIRNNKEASKKHSLLTETKAKTVLVKRAAEMDLRERSAELMAAQKRFVNAEKCVRVLHLVEKHLSDNIMEYEAKMESWVKHPVV